MSIIFKTEQLVQEIQRQFKKLKEAVAGLKKLKGSERRDRVDFVKTRNIRSIKNSINSLQYSINLNEENMDKMVISKQKDKLNYFKDKIQMQIKNIEYDRNEKLQEKDIFEDRRDSRDKRNNRGQLIQQTYQAQKQSEDKTKSALRMLYEMKGINDGVNIELQRQIDQLDAVYDQLQQAESNMNRAMRHINYFARSVYEDKLLMSLLVLIILSVIAIIVLSALGKIPEASQDTIQ